jgi:16S rRNA processing protein RimM
MAELRNPLVVGRVQAAFAVRGWLKVHSYTRPRGNLLHYRKWWVRRQDRWLAHEVTDWKQHGNSLLVKLAGIADRNAALECIGSLIAIPRAALPAAEPGEYYWADLIGLRVRTREGTELGRVAALLETGAHDVLVVRDGSQTLIPFVPGVYVLAVDLAGGAITVDWPSA